MADYFTTFSFEILKKDVDFPLEDITTMIDAYRDREYNDLPKWFKDKFSIDDFGEDTVEEYMNIGYKLENDFLWIYSKEYPNIDSLVSIIQSVMKHYNSKKYISFEYAFTCNKLRTDGFGGGAVFINSSEVKFFNTCNWVQEQIKQFEKKKGDKINV